MTKPIIYFFLVWFFSTSFARAQEVKVLTFTEFEEEMKNQAKDKLVLINFWATWCKPCVEELPELMELNEEFQENSDFELWMVSLDSPKALENKLKPFISEHQMQGKMMLLNDIRNMNKWIPKVDNKWSGSLPATLIYKDLEKIFFIEDVINKKEIKEIIQTNIEE